MSVYAENAKLNFSYDRRFLAISAGLERNRAKKSVDTHINFHLYHYAGNNPVKYSDPDGEFIIPMAIGAMMLPKSAGEYKYFDNTQPQRFGGYYNCYENFTSNNIVCNLDSLRTDFTNSNGKKSSVWLWKGNYNLLLNGGWHNGAEVGAYGPNGGADDSLLASVSIELTDKDTNQSVSRSTANKYWTNRFDKGKTIPSSLKLSATLTFNNETDAESYCNALNEGIGTVGEKYPNTYFGSMNRDNESLKIKAMQSGRQVNVIFE